MSKVLVKGSTLLFQAILTLEMFTIVNMSKATLCNSLERVTEAVPKVQYSGQYHWVQTKTDPVSVTTSVPTQSPQQPPPPVEASFVKTLHPGPGTEAN